MSPETSRAPAPLHGQQQPSHQLPAPTPSALPKAALPADAGSVAPTGPTAWGKRAGAERGTQVGLEPQLESMSTLAAEHQNLSDQRGPCRRMPLPCPCHSMATKQQGVLGSWVWQLETPGIGCQWPGHHAVLAGSRRCTFHTAGLGTFLSEARRNSAVTPPDLPRGDPDTPHWAEAMAEGTWPQSLPAQQQPVHGHRATAQPLLSLTCQPVGLPRLTRVC